MLTRFALFSLCLVVAVVFEDVSARFIDCPESCFVTFDSHCVCPLGGSYEKRGVRLPFRYGKRNNDLPSKFQSKDSILNSINPYRLFSDLDEE